MNNLGFKNFGRYAEFPALNLGKINFLVGKNNSGKSTFIKAMLLCANNLPILGQKKDPILVGRQYPYFRFDVLSSNMKTSSFQRALFSNAKPDNTIYYKKNIFGDVMPISFNFSEDGFKYEITLHREKDDESWTQIETPVSTIKVEDTIHGLSYTFDYVEEEIIVEILKDIENWEVGDKISLNMMLPEDNDVDYNWKHEFIELLRGFIENIHYKIREQEEVAKKSTVNGEITDQEKFTQAVDLHFYYRLVNDHIVPVINKTIERINPRRPYIEFMSHVNHNNKSVFNINDKGDDIAQIFHEYHLHRNNYLDNFIRKYLSLFEIGQDFSLECIEGESYVMRIIDGDYHCNLMDKGIGTVNLVILLLRLALLIPKYPAEIEYEWGDDITIILEEPEQNLHPCLQSKIVDLIADVNKTYGFNFIIETHSEYLIRKSQVLVSNANYQDDEALVEDNWFKTFYFPSNDIPYDMEYTKSGLFRRKFGPGFFDEAGGMHLEILKKSLDSQKQSM